MSRRGHYTKHTVKNNVPDWKQELIGIAQDLCYPKEYITRLRAATTENEGIRIMTTARNNAE